MSVVGEVVAVAAMVAALVSAYRDGSVIVRRLKEKRRLRKALAPSKLLEESLERGPPAVEEARNAGIAKFGDAFAYGDDHARNSLRDIIIELQGGIIRELGKALEDDNQVDFSFVVEASETGRMRAVVVLNELYLRLATPAGTVVTAISPFFASRTVQDPRTITGPSTPHATANIDTQLLAQIKTFPLDESDGAPVATDQVQQVRKSRVSFSQQLQRVFSTPGLRRSSTAEPGEPDTRRPSLATTIMSSSRSSFSTQSTLVPQTSTFDGFCRGAYCLQVGLAKDAVKLRNASQSFQGEGYYLTCASSKCCFETPAIRNGANWMIDTAVEEAYGMQFRRSFLVKSHVTTSRAKGRSYKYQCFFCVQQCREITVLTGVTELIKHVASHRGEELPKRDRMVTDGEDFDVKFVDADVPLDDYRSCRSQLSSSSDDDDDDDDGDAEMDTLSAFTMASE